MNHFNRAGGAVGRVAVCSAIVIAFGGCGSLPDVVSTHGPEVIARQLEGAETTGVSGLRALRARYLELAGEQTRAFEVWLGAEPSPWRTCRLARLITFRTPSTEDVASLMAAGTDLEPIAARVADALGMPEPRAGAELGTSQSRAIPHRPPTDVGGAAAAVETALCAGDLRRAEHHAENLDLRDPLALAAHLAVMEARVQRHGATADTEAAIDAIPRGGNLGFSNELALSRLEVQLGRTERARDRVESLLARSDLDPSARREALIESLRLADTTEDIAGFGLARRALEDAGGKDLDLLGCAARLEALRILSQRDGAGGTHGFALARSVGTSGHATEACAELHVFVAQRLVEHGNHATADRIIANLVGPEPADARPWHSRLRAAALDIGARAALARGDRERARALLSAAIAEGGAGTSRHRLALLDAVDRREAGSELTGVPRLRAALLADARALGVPVTDARTAIRQALSRQLSAYLEVILNERVDMFDGDGHALSRMHRIMCFHDADATQRYGEVPLEPGEDVLLARTWKVRRQGSHLQLDAMDADEAGPDPEIATLASLEPGDCAELVSLREHGAAGAEDLPMGARFFFDDERGPTHVARYGALTPDADAPVALAIMNAPPELSRESLQGRAVLVARNVPAFVAEEGDVRPDRRRFSARHTPPADVGAHRETLDRLVRGAAVPSSDVRRLARDAIANTPPDAWFDALRRAVNGRVDEDVGSVFQSDVDQTLSTRRGSRALALLAAARAVGLPAELWLARPLSDAARGSDILEDYVWPLVVASPSDAPTVVDPRSPTGHPAAIVRDTSALALGGEDTPRDVHVPATPAGEHRVTYVLDLDPATSRFTGKGRDVLTGLFAESWRGFIARIPEVNHPILLTHVAGSSFPGAASSEHVLSGLAPTDDALTWTYAISGRLTVLSPERVELSWVLASDDPLGSTGSLGARNYPLFFNQIADTSVDVCVRWPAGWKARELPESHRIDADGFRWELQVDSTDDCSLRLTKRYVTAPRWVGPDTFQAFRRLAATISQRDHVRLELAMPQRDLLGPIGPVSLQR